MYLIRCDATASYETNTHSTSLDEFKSFHMSHNRDDDDDENFIWVSMYLATIANWGHYLVITNIRKIL